jgi:XTP/dITP diphosphohydrolase
VRLTVLVTTPRLPAGLLTGDAWRTLFAADAVLSAEPSSSLVRAVEAAGVGVEAAAGLQAADLLTRAATSDVVWLASEAGDDELTSALAADVVRRAETAEDGPEVEIMVGSFDPVGGRLLDLVDVMDRLRRECPWDQEQTHESLVRYLLEETYETIEAIESGDAEHLREELGDLLLQVMFHARIGSEDPDLPFSIDDVAGHIVEKLIRRHPHVFADVEVDGAAEVEANWDSIKAAEKSRNSSMEGIPPGLPALSLAEKVVGRALQASMPISVPTPAESAYTSESLGDVLFALVAAAHGAGLDAEQALRQRVRHEVAEVRAAEQRALPDEPPPSR